jgi:hypothetical protein
VEHPLLYHDGNPPGSSPEVIHKYGLRVPLRQLGFCFLFVNFLPGGYNLAWSNYWIK